MNKKYRNAVLRLYNRFYETRNLATVEKIIFEANTLINEMISRYGNFLEDEYFYVVDSFNRFAIFDFIGGSIFLDQHSKVL